MVTFEEMTMPSSNPAFGRGFARAASGQGPAGAGWGTAPQYGAPAPTDPYAAPSPYARSATRYMTMDDVVTKTGLSFLVTVLFAAGICALPGTTGWGFAFPFAIADEAIRRGAPAKFAWYIAFGLIVTVVWLYLEILRLLSYFRN